jgi:vacuolar iron transporter family protein
MSTHHNNYIHHKKSTFRDLIREIIFGLEDGMVSTFGSITGIAIATQNPHTTILAGTVIICVESISMSVGSYISSKSEKEINTTILNEEKEELILYPKEELLELEEMYITDGWPKKLSKEMALTASKNKDLFLKEMALRELHICDSNKINPIKGAFAMLCSYLVGGLIPLLAYFFLSITIALYFSIILTLTALFFLGVFTTKYTKRIWWKAGLEMFSLAGIAGFIGYLVGYFVEYLM